MPELTIASFPVKPSRPTPVHDTDPVNGLTPCPADCPELPSEAMAVAYLMMHPSWSNEQIAAALGCSPPILDRWQLFRATRQMLQRQPITGLRCEMRASGESILQTSHHQPFGGIES